jgi:hypothetical protein
MDVTDVPTALQDRLGPEATAGLIELLLDAREEWTTEMIERVGDRFERRLMEETTKLRIEMTQGFAALRQEMTEGFAAIRQEMTEGFAAIRHEMADQRFALLKWAFLFWIGQFFAVASLMVVLIRFLRPGA